MPRANSPRPFYGRRPPAAAPPSDRAQEGQSSPATTSVVPGFAYPGSELAWGEFLPPFSLRCRAHRLPWGGRAAA